ncbi:MAG: PD40 domain-containing protein [Bacteroidia bacterium]|nr:PD40 domain-containing protein [Bacteroidia bacterium]
MLFRKSLILLFLFTASFTFAQRNKYKDFFTKGNDFLLEENYSLALQEFMNAYKIDSTNANINFKIGYCYTFHPSQKHLAEDYFAKAVLNVNKEYKEDDPMYQYAPYYALFYYGQALHTDYKFEEALKMYDQYESYLDKKKFKEDIEILNHYRQMCKNAKDKMAAPVKITITNMGDSLNSEFADFSPVVSADERMIIFTYRGNEGTGASEGLRTSDGRYFEDVFVSYKKDDGGWTRPVPLSKNVNTNGHEGAVGLTPDGQELLIYRDDAGDGNIYHSSWNGKEWSVPLKFGPEINSKYWEPSACFSADGDILFFVSDRPGGFGGRDLYRCKKLPNGKWSLPLNLGPKINTQYDEESPFLHPNGKDFYFSSEGHSTMGGFDIMVAEMDADGKFGDVVDMPYPINTTDDDVFYVTSPDSRRAYYASSHEDRNGFGEKDIYLISLVDNNDQELLALFKGIFIPAKGENLPEGLEVIVTDKNTGDLVGIYRPQRSGTFTTILKPDMEYVVSYQKDGVEFQIEDLPVKKENAFQQINREIPLKPVQLAGTKKASEEAMLNVNVILKGEKEKPVAGAKIEIAEKDKDVPFTSYTANAKGVYENIKIETEKNYELKASSGTNTSEVLQFSTSGLNTKKLNKTIYLAEIVAVAANAEKAKFSNYFVYNKNKVESNPEYDKFLTDFENCVRTNGKAEITINSSASKVPTTQYGGSNLKLAQTRANNLKTELTEYLQKKGLPVKGIVFKLKPIVGGPEYKGDFIVNKKEFEKHQFVEAIVR